MRTPTLGLALCAVLLASPAAQAKDLRKRFAVGFADQLGGTPSLALRYGLPMPEPAINLQVELSAGFSVDGDDQTADGLTVGGRLLYSLVAEDNMNLYASAGAGWVSSGGAGVVRLQPGLSAQFFLFGLENLGFSADWGVCIDLGQPTGAATYSAAPGVGVHYYV